MPNSPHNILCPVDFSEISALGLRFAESIAKCSQAHLSVVFADPFLPPPYFTQGKLDELKTQIAESKLEARKSLVGFVRETLGEDARPGLKVVEALPVDGILQAVKEISADLIAMGTHGRSGVNRLMLGSVAERVLRESSVPVLTVRPDPEKAESPAIRRIVCPVNDSEIARRALAYAAELARCFGAELTVLHVREGGHADSITDLCKWVPEAVRSMCAVRETTREGEAAQEIVTAASELSCDLMVLGAQHRRFSDSTVLGTTTVRVVRHAPCAVLTVVEKE